MLNKEKECMHEFVSISKAEENYMKQKFRNNLLNLEDNNSLYFHRRVKDRNSKNVITYLWNENGEKVKDNK